MSSVACGAKGKYALYMGSLKDFYTYIKKRKGDEGRLASSCSPSFREADLQGIVSNYLPIRFASFAGGRPRHFSLAARPFGRWRRNHGTRETKDDVSQVAVRRRRTIRDYCSDHPPLSFVNARACG